MKNRLGLDLGTNSIGWALIRLDEKDNPVEIRKAGSRIIPMSQDILGKFNSGNSISQTAERTAFRGTRRLRERHLLRRERLHRILHILKFLPTHYDQSIGWNKEDNSTYGKFIDNKEPKLAWCEQENGQYSFIFSDSFREMVADFHQSSQAAIPKQIPYDWTIYYLRKKALEAPLTRQELAWLILHFNQKRGYYQLRGEENEITNKKEEYHALKVTHVEKENEPGKGGAQWYAITLENGWVYKRSSKIPLDNWLGTIQNFIITTEYDKNGEPKRDNEGVIKRSFRSPKEDDWGLVKKKTEANINSENTTVGAYIFKVLLENPKQKIKGKLIRTIERTYYKEELRMILRKQQEFIPELRDPRILAQCIEELYPHNVAHQENLLQKDFIHLIVEDIIFYQRPLKSQKHLIANCPYEYYTYLKNGEKQIEPIKCISKSNPLFQEFRLWQFISNLRIYKREGFSNGKLLTDVDVTGTFLNAEKRIELFDFLNERSEIKQDILLKEFFNLKKDKSKKQYPYRWNYVEDKSYPCNETRAFLRSLLKKSGVENSFLTQDIEKHLWHLLYSVEDRVELGKALSGFIHTYHLPEEFKNVFSNCPPFKKEYGSYSEKAIKKLLALMREGKYWSKENFDPKTLERIDKLLDGEDDETINLLTRQRTREYRSVADFQGIPLYLACYIVYGRHSESGNIKKWNSPEEIELYLLNEFKQHSLRNPIVEQVVRETLRTVQDIWKTYGGIHEIHLELGREMKNPADKRARMTQQINENENRNLRIKALLMELKKDANIENVRPFSPGQQEILKIYEEGALSSVQNLPEDIARISKMDSPTPSELLRYKLWLEQKYRSPYTGIPIPLGKLFTPAYEIEHIIPQSRYFDDSLSNKVICESEINKLKDNQLGYEFISNHEGEVVTGGYGKPLKVFEKHEYQQFVKLNYSNNRAKMKKLLLEEIPEAFIERQLNDSRYIARVVKGLLSNIVRDKDETTTDSTHVISCSGQITSWLKKEWGLSDVLDRIIQPRFERLNRMDDIPDSTRFGEQTGNRFQIRVPYEYQKGFNKKRIDHRHHALDAIVIACATRAHINYLNNTAANDKNTRFVLADQLRRMEDTEYTVIQNGKEVRKKIRVAKEFIKPWSSFTSDVQTVLEHLIISFKQNVRVLGKTNNYTLYYDETGKKRYRKQTKGDGKSIRKPLHKDTVAARITLREKKTVRFAIGLQNWENLVDKQLKAKIRELIIQYRGFNEKTIFQWFKDRKFQWNGKDVSKVDIYVFTNDYSATRKTVDKSFNQKTIDAITDSGIRKILTNYLVNKGNNPEIAFSPEGLDSMNENIRDYNDGKPHHPILKVRTYETFGNKFAVGSTGNKKTKYVEAAKGTNLFFGIYQTEQGKRSYETIPLNVVIERLKQGETPLPSARQNKETEDKLLFWLSPNDLVYVPTEEEQENPHLVDFSNLTTEQIKRIYKMVSSTGNECFFIPVHVATSIVNKVEFSPLNKMEKTTDGITIKSVCWKLKVNRLGVITEVQK